MTIRNTAEATNKTKKMNRIIDRRLYDLLGFSMSSTCIFRRIAIKPYGLNSEAYTLYNEKLIEATYEKADRYKEYSEYEHVYDLYCQQNYINRNKNKEDIVVNSYSHSMKWKKSLSNLSDSNNHRKYEYEIWSKLETDFLKENYEEIKDILYVGTILI